MSEKAQLDAHPALVPDLVSPFTLRRAALESPVVPRAIWMGVSPPTTDPGPKAIASTQTYSLTASSSPSITQSSYRSSPAMKAMCRLSGCAATAESHSNA
jgi:hypothetical protein